MERKARRNEVGEGEGEVGRSTLFPLGSFSCFLSSADFFQNQLFRKKSFRNAI